MSTGHRDSRSGLVELYRASLQRRLEQGDWTLVCRDEELTKEVETRLSKGAAQDTHSPLGFDPLSVMETSLQATSGQVSLKRLAKGFEVLELAALNLYLFPWRKEYRVVKTFSGMFTHCIKPAFTSQQVKELFGLLGYQSTSTGEEQELKLGSKPVRADSLLRWACAFFAARIECHLLLFTAPSKVSKVEWDRQLVLERKRGHSLQTTLESAKRKLQSASQNTDLTDADAVEDLYTDDGMTNGGETEGSHMTAPPSLSYIPPKDNSLSFTTQSNRENADKTVREQPVRVSSLTCQISPNPKFTSPKSTELPPMSLKTHEYEKQSTAVGGAHISVASVGQAMCDCNDSHNLYAHYCPECRESHNVLCPCYKRCKEQGHNLRLAEQHDLDVRSQATQEHVTSHMVKNHHDSENLSKDSMRKHSCMNESKSNFFCVCYDCHQIHEFDCGELKYCQDVRHNVQATGELQPPQPPSGATAPPKRHTCLIEGGKEYLVCFTCNQSHDCICKEGKRCLTGGHFVKYPELHKEEPVTVKPLTLHECCTSTMPDVACLTCRVFHIYSCVDMQCILKHQQQVQRVKKWCSQCSDGNLYTLCSYCCAVYCKKCWFETPMDCKKCGMSFTTPV